MSGSAQVLVVDNRSAIRSAIAAELIRKGIATVEACDGASGWQVFQESNPALVVTYLGLPKSNAVALLRRIRASSSVPVVVLTAVGETQATRVATGAESNESPSAPNEIERLLPLIEDLLAEAFVRPESGGADPAAIIGRSACMQRVRRQVQGIAPLKNLPVLVCGESGTGRDHIVATILALAGHSSDDLLKVSAGGSARDLARQRHPAIYLDGIEALSSDDQHFIAKTYSAKGVHRPGSLPRLFASTSQDENAILGSGDLDADLVAVFRRVVIELPPLRSRISDISQLAPALAANIGRELGRPEVRFSSAAITRLKQYSWPGNVRELSEVIEQLVAFSGFAVVGPRDVVEALRSTRSTVHAARRQREEEQRHHLTKLLTEAGGNLAEVARQLGLSRSTVHYRALKYGLIERRAGRTES